MIAERWASPAADPEQLMTIPLMRSSVEAASIEPVISERIVIPLSSSLIMDMKSILGCRSSIEPERSIRSMELSFMSTVDEPAEWAIAAAATMKIPKMASSRENQMPASVARKEMKNFFIPNKLM